MTRQPISEIGDPTPRPRTTPRLERAIHPTEDVRTGRALRDVSGRPFVILAPYKKRRARSLVLEGFLILGYCLALGWFGWLFVTVGVDSLPDPAAHAGTADGAGGRP